MSDWSARNKEHIREYQKQYRLKNKDRITKETMENR